MIRRISTSFFVLLLTVSVFACFVPVRAESYYNWLDNPSFNSMSDWIEDGGFESGSLNSGVTYGNWSSSNPTYARIGSLDVNNGVYSGEIYTASSAKFWYNLTDSYYVLGADVSSFTFYAEDTLSAYVWGFDVVLVYSDDSTDTYQNSTYAGGYVQYDITSEVDTSKYLVAFYFTTDSNTNFHFDDVSMLVDDGSSQDEITQNTSPWFLGGSYPSTFGNLNDAFGRLDDTSVQLEGDSTYKLIQNIAFIYASDVHYIDMWIYDASGSNSMSCTVVYSDRSTDTKTVTFTGSGWTQVNFGQVWLDDSKLIIQIRFSIGESGSGGNCDDFGLWVAVGEGNTRFSYALSPSAIVQSVYSFDGYCGVAYTITGYVYNSTGSLANDGIYQLTTTYGYTSGVITEGVFSVTLSARGGSDAGSSELLGFLFTMNNSEVLSVTLTAYWYAQSADVDDSNDSGFSELINNSVEYITALIVMIILPAVFGYIFHNVYLFALLMPAFTVIGFGAGMLSFLYVIISIVVCVAVMFFGRSGSGNGGG